MFSPETVIGRYIMHSVHITNNRYLYVWSICMPVGIIVHSTIYLCYYIGFFLLALNAPCFTHRFYKTNHSSGAGCLLRHYTENFRIVDSSIRIIIIIIITIWKNNNKTKYERTFHRGIYSYRRNIWFFFFVTHNYYTYT